MSNYNRYRGHGSSGSSFIAPYLIGYAVGSLIQGFIWYHNGYNAGKGDENHLRDVQLQNEQVQAQLDSRFQDVGKLVLNDGDKTFSFDMRAVSGVDETYNGKYQVQNSAASIIGNLSCTQVVLPSPSPTK